MYNVSRADSVNTFRHAFLRQGNREHIARVMSHLSTNLRPSQRVLRKQHVRSFFFQGSWVNPLGLLGSKKMDVFFSYKILRKSAFRSPTSIRRSANHPFLGNRTPPRSEDRIRAMEEGAETPPPPPPESKEMRETKGNGLVLGRRGTLFFLQQKQHTPCYMVE